LYGSTHANAATDGENAMRCEVSTIDICKQSIKASEINTHNRTMGECGFISAAAGQATYVYGWHQAISLSS